MSRPGLLTAFVFTFCICSPFPAASAVDGRTVKVEPFILTTFDGQDHPAELVRMTVPENRHTKSQRSIEVAAVRLPHRGAQAGTPIVFLPPGPGVPASILGRVPVYFRLLDRLRDAGDVILFDLRGEGMSSPNLDDCPPPATVSLRTFESFESYVQQLAASVSNCALFWRSKGVDLPAYNNHEIAEDLQELRLALRYEHISLLGFSAGTDLGIEILRLHGDEVQKAVFAATGAAELKPNLPLTYDVQLEKVALWYGAGPKGKPDLVELFDADVKALDKEPVAMTLTEGADKHQVEVKVGSVALKAVVTDMLNGSVEMLPALLTSVQEHDYSLLQILIQKRFTGFHSGMSLIGRTIDCSAIAPSDRITRAQNEARLSRFGDMRNVHLHPSVCRAALGAELPSERAPSPLFSTVQTLFISSNMDPNTPPSNAEMLLWGLPNGSQVIVKNGFHETLPSPDIQNLVVDFFSGKGITNCKIVFDRPHALSLDEARTAAARSR